jgi:hypothetical protein
VYASFLWHFKGENRNSKVNLMTFSRLVKGGKDGNFIEKIFMKMVSIGWTWLGKVGIRSTKALPVAFVLEPLKLPRE